MAFDFKNLLNSQKVRNATAYEQWAVDHILSEIKWLNERLELTEHKYRLFDPDGVEVVEDE